MSVNVAFWMWLSHDVYKDIVFLSCAHHLSMWLCKCTLTQSLNHPNKAQWKHTESTMKPQHCCNPLYSSSLFVTVAALLWHARMSCKLKCKPYWLGHNISSTVSHFIIIMSQKTERMTALIKNFERTLNAALLHYTHSEWIVLCSHSS